MAYTPYEWADGEAGGTPITAERLNHIEQGIADIELTPGPQGATGDKGDKGDKGDPGADGADGADGAPTQAEWAGHLDDYAALEARVAALEAAAGE